MVCVDDGIGIDNKPPKEMSHLKNKRKAKLIMEERNAEIQLENRILLDKMLNIDKERKRQAQRTCNKMYHVRRRLHHHLYMMIIVKGEAIEEATQRRQQEYRQWGGLAHQNKKMLNRLTAVPPAIVDTQK